MTVTFDSDTHRDPGYHFFLQRYISFDLMPDIASVISYVNRELLLFVAFIILDPTDIKPRPPPTACAAAASEPET